MLKICSLPKQDDGYYDKDNNWVRTKFCLVYCGPDRCTCSNPRTRIPIKKEENETNTTNS